MYLAEGLREREAHQFGAGRHLGDIPSGVFHLAQVRLAAILSHAQFVKTIGGLNMAKKSKKAKRGAPTRKRKKKAMPARKKLPARKKKAPMPPEPPPVPPALP
jgi:hypothetical protein